MSDSIQADGEVSQAYRSKGVTTLEEALKWTHKLPYGRNSGRGNCMLIFEEGRGTCSTKHAALARLCEENQFPAELHMVICRLDAQLAPESAAMLENLGVDYLPEAHCYLHLDGRDVDVTFPNQEPVLKAEVLESHVIGSGDIGERKLKMYQEYLRRWAEERGLSFDELWTAREKWIASLAEKVQVRPYRPDDASALASIYYHTIHEINKEHYNPEQIAAWAPDSSLNGEEWLTKFEKTQPLVAVAGDQPVGFAELEPSGYIDCFYGHHAWQGKGVGSALMRAVCEKAKKLSITRLHADVSITARPFFERKGFQVVSEQTVTLRGVDFTNYEMEKFL